MIYLDYNATTPLCDAAREAMLPYLGRYFGNPSSVHAAGREARAAIDNARDKLGALLRTKPGEIIFTGGATESCNLAVLGLARSSSSRGGHIISNKAEHHAVLHPLEHLEQHEGFEVTWLNVSESGMVDLDQLADSIRPDTRLVSIMTAQQRDRRDPADARNLTDMPRRAASCFTATWSRRSGKRMSMSLLSMSRVLLRTSSMDQRAQAFFVFAAGLPIQPIMFGGAHENQRRPGTENVAGIAGMAAAAEWILRDRETEQERRAQLRDQLWTKHRKRFS